MAKKEPKVARIVYHEGDPSKPNTVMEHEGFFFEAWVQTGGDLPYGWSTICKAQCVSRAGLGIDKQKELPPGKNYIYWEILKHIADWSKMGYTIYYGKRETAYLDEREREEWAKHEAKQNKKKVKGHV